MGHPDLVVNINGWFGVFVSGEESHGDELNAVVIACGKYAAEKSRALGSKGYDPDFNWTIQSITICEVRA